MSATIIKNMLNKEGYSSQWFKLNEEIKTIVKNNILSTLASNDIDIRNTKREFGDDLDKIQALKYA